MQDNQTINLQTLIATLQNSVQALNLIATNITDGFGAAFLYAPLVASAVYDPGSIATLEQATTTVTVTGAALGDYVQVSFSLSLQDITLTGYVSAANTVTAVFWNGTTGAIDLASGTLRARVWRTS